MMNMLWRSQDETQVLNTIAEETTDVLQKKGLVVLYYWWIKLNRTYVHNDHNMKKLSGTIRDIFTIVHNVTHDEGNKIFYISLMLGCRSTQLIQCKDITVFHNTMIARYSSFVNIDFVHILIDLCSCIVSIKMWFDGGINNNTAAKICSMNLKDINRLERDFLHTVNYSINMTSNELLDFYENVNALYVKIKSDSGSRNVKHNEENMVDEP